MFLKLTSGLIDPFLAQIPLRDFSPEHDARGSFFSAIKEKALCQIVVQKEYNNALFVFFKVSEVGLRTRGFLVIFRMFFVLTAFFLCVY